MNSGVKWEQSQHAGLHVIMNCSCSVKYAAMVPQFVGGRNRFKYAMCGSEFLVFKSPFSYFIKKKISGYVWTGRHDRGSTNLGPDH